MYQLSHRPHLFYYKNPVEETHDPYSTVEQWEEKVMSAQVGETNQVLGGDGDKYEVGLKLGGRKRTSALLVKAH